MGKKKKTASNKLAKMSDEDRARYLQQRADIEEEARRRKQELIASYLKNKLKHEEAFMRINLAKINQEWRQILRRTTCKELKSELEAVRNGIDEVLQRKQDMINYLLQELDENDDQYNRSFQTHMTTVERMMGVYKEQLDDMNSAFEQAKDDAVFKSIRDRMGIEEDHEAKCNHLKTILFQVQTGNQKDAREMKETRLGWRQEFETESQCQYDILSTNQVSKIGELWKDISQVLTDYLTRTEIKRKEYATLKQIDAEESANIAEHCSVITKQTDLIETLCEEFKDLQAAKRAKILSLTNERNGLIKKLAKSKRDSAALLQWDASQLTNLTVISNAVLDKLRKVYQKGEFLLQGVTVCRKLESERDKVDPWHGFDAEPVTPCKEYINKMEKFWWRYNLVLTECESYRMTNQKLDDENRDLRAEMQDYLSEVVLEGPTRTPAVSIDLIPPLSISVIKRKESIAVLKCK